VKKAGAVFAQAFFQAAGEIIKQKLPKATLIDFHGCAVSTGLPFRWFFLFASFSFL